MKIEKQSTVHLVPSCRQAERVRKMKSIDKPDAKLKNLKC